MTKIKVFMKCFNMNFSYLCFSYRPSFVARPQGPSTSQQQQQAWGTNPAVVPPVHQLGAQPAYGLAAGQQVLMPPTAPAPAMPVIQQPISLPDQATAQNPVQQQAAAQLQLQQPTMAQSSVAQQQGAAQMLQPPFGISSSDSSSTSGSSSASAASNASWGSYSTVPQRPTFQSLRAEDLFRFDA